MDTIEGMRTFAAVVREGSFSAAARRLDRSPQLVSKYVARLEDRLGVRLVNRSTRRLSLTEAGAAYADRCQQLLDDIDDMESAVAGMAAHARGTLRINAPMSFGVTHLSPAVASYQAEQPDVAVELVMNDRVVDVVAEGYDLAIRIGRLQESTLVARRLAPVRLVLCAAPAYVDRHGAPEAPEDLERHNCLAYTYYSDRREWVFERAERQVQVRTSGNFTANNGDALCRAAVAGAGIILQPSFIVADELRRGRLRELMPGWRSPDLAVYALYAHRQHLSAKVRTFVDHVAGHFGGQPYWDRDVRPSTSP